MKLADRAAHRGRQFLGAIRPRVDDGLRVDAYALLSESERGLFETMTLRDQQHCLDVFRRLREQARDERDLLVAALLHDAGKGRVAVWHRVAFVMLEAATPGLLRRAVRPGDGPGWREALHRCLHHAELGATLARQAGCCDRVVELIAGDKESADDGLLALRAADDAG